jgi:hypothetical protein
MVDLTELDGVGPARSESLEEAGYEDFASLAEADPEALAEDAEITEDKALDFIVQSQNIVAEQDAEVEESKPVTQEVADAVEEAEDEEDEVEVEEDTISVKEGEDKDEAESEPEPEPEDNGPEVIEFELTFEEALEYDTFFDAVMSQRATMLRTNRDGADAFDHALEQMRGKEVGDSVELEMTEPQLNGLHNSVREMTVSYKGDNLIDHMDALKRVLNRINEVRSEHLF